MARPQSFFSTAEPETALAPNQSVKANRSSEATTILPVLLPPATLRPVAFRVFTKKHSLTITASTLQLLATFVGKNCGTAWREEGLAEVVFDHVAKAWKKAGGGVILEDGKPVSLKAILKGLESNMSGGRVVSRDISERELPPLAFSGDEANGKPTHEYNSHGDRSLSGTGDTMSGEGGIQTDFNSIRRWIKVVGAFDQPRLIYDMNRKHFDVLNAAPSVFSAPSQRVNLIRERYNLIHQRLLRNEAFRAPLSTSGIPPSLRRSASSLATTEQSYNLTSIANLLGRSGTSHLLLGLLSISPTGQLSLTDPTGSINLNLQHAVEVPENGAWYSPGMIVLVDGIYQEESVVAGTTLQGNDGVGGTVSGTFIGVSIGGPPCERRDTTLGISDPSHGRDLGAEGGFGWVDFLGVGSERAQGNHMRQIEKKCLQSQSHATSGRNVVILSEIHLDVPQTIDALKSVFEYYSSSDDGSVPALFVLIGNFVQYAVMSGATDYGSVECKEYFNALASVLSDYPRLLRKSTFVFVPGDNDPWASSYTAGSVSAIPREPIPEIFTSRVKRAFKAASSDVRTVDSEEPEGTAIWTTNPSRISVFGPVQDFVVFRDDITGRLRRSSLTFNRQKKPVSEDAHGVGLDADGEAAAPAGSQIDAHSVDGAGNASGTPQTGVSLSQKLVKTILDQSNMSPFPINIRPVLWDYASALHLHPLPTALILADAEAEPFAITYEGCHVMNPGRLVPEGSKGLARWIEYDIAKRKGTIRKARF